MILMASKRRQSVADSNEIFAALLFTDVDLAFGFLQCAERSSFIELRRSNLANAAKAYRHILAKSLKMGLPSDKREELTTKLVLLKQKLAEFGIDV